MENVMSAMMVMNLLNQVQSGQGMFGGMGGPTMGMGQPNPMMGGPMAMPSRVGMPGGPMMPQPAYVPGVSALTCVSGQFAERIPGCHAVWRDGRLCCTGHGADDWDGCHCRRVSHSQGWRPGPRADSLLRDDFLDRYVAKQQMKQAERQMRGWGGGGYI